jgi:uncharacterized protein YegP (UPF0339 family)
MATATQKERAARQVARRAKAAAVITFAVFEDNGGDYRWKIVDGGGESLAQSGTFASYDDARKAASVVHDGARTARFGHPPAADLAARGETARVLDDFVLDDSDAGRWLDDDGQGGEAVKR